MILSSVVIAGAATAGTVGALKYRERKRKREFPWAERLRMAKKGVPLGQNAKQAARWRVSLGTVGREFTDKLMAPYVSQARREQLAEITAKEAKEEVLQISAAEKRERRNFHFASGSLLLAAGGSLFYAPLYVPSVLMMAYVFRDWPKKAIKALVEERRVGAEMIMAVSVPGIVLSGFIFGGALGLWYNSIMCLILAKTENHTRKSMVNLFGQQPRFVWVLVDSADGEGKEEVEIPFEQLKSGDLVVVTAGQTIPVDGTISRGMAH